MKKPCRPADICAHLGDDYDRYLGAIVPPLFQNTLFTRKHEEHGYSYSRINNPTIEIWKKAGCAGACARSTCVRLRHGGHHSHIVLTAALGRPCAGSAQRLPSRHRLFFFFWIQR